MENNMTGSWVGVSGPFQRTLWIIIFFGTIVIITICSIALAEDTFSSQPSYHSSTDHIYETLYSTQFDSINDFKKTETGFLPWTGYIVCANGNMEIKSVVTETHYVTSRSIDYFTSDFLCDGRSYEIWFEFMVSNDLQNKFTVFNNGEINLYVTSGGGNQRLISEKEAGVEVFIKNLNPNQWYFFWISAFHQAAYNKYELIIQGVNYGAYQYTNQPAVQNVVFGDRVAANKGHGSWNLFQLNGWSKAQYFNNFDDGSCHEFREIVYTPGLVGRNNGEAIVKVDNNALYFDTFWNPGSADEVGYINTEYINYDPEETWRISLDFKVMDGYSDHFILVNNEQALITYASGGLYWWDSHMQYYHFVKNIQTGTWYFLELVKYAGVQYYKIIINRNEEASWCVYNSYNEPDWKDYLFIGNPPNTGIDGIYIDNVKLIVESRSQQDADSDGLGDDFENKGGTDPKIVVWSTDFEDRHDGNVRDLEELGWEFYPALNGPGDTTKWESGEITYTDPNQLYPTPAKGHAYGIFTGSNGKVLGVDLDSTYPSNCNYRISTPTISTANVQSGLLITFYMWLDSEAGTNGDGGQILISVNGGDSYSVLGTYNSPYNTQNVAVFSNGPGFTGAMQGWNYVHISLGGGYVGSGKTIKLAFLFKSDADQNIGSGWYIDDIKIYGNLNKNNDDTDDDGLNDFEEFHKYCSSPFISDTDGDSLTDKEEVKEQALATWEFYVNYQGEYNSWSDPLTKDIWVEVDEMAYYPGDPANREWAYDNYAVRDVVTDSFSEHEISIHFVYSEATIAAIPGATTAQIEAIAKIEADGGHREDANNEYKFYHYLLWANTHYDSYYGEAYASHWFTVVYAKHQSLDSSGKRANALMWDLGLNLGLWYYNGNYYDDNGNTPPDSSMKSGIGSWNDYLDEESDWTYEYRGVSPYEDRVLGGWEYAHTNLAVFKRGLDYSGIFKDEDFINTGWTY
jgi:hypothetical protein